MASRRRKKQGCQWDVFRLRQTSCRETRNVVRDMRYVLCQFSHLRFSVVIHCILSRASVNGGFGVSRFSVGQLEPLIWTCQAGMRLGGICYLAFIE